MRISYGYAIPFFLAVLGWWLYAPTLESEFHFDDYVYILESSEITDLKYCLNSLADNIFRPDRMLVTLTFGLNYLIHDYSLPGYHIVNILLHLLNSCLVFLLAYLLLETTAGASSFSRRENKSKLLYAVIGATLFLLHPVAVNSVTYISQRHGLLATFFYISGIVLFVKFRQIRGIKAFLLFAGCLMCYWAGIHSKPMALTLPITLVAYELVFLTNKKQLWRKIFSILLPLSAVFLVILVGYAYFSGLFSAGADIAGFRSSLLWSPWQHMMTESFVFLHYWKILFLPLPQWLSGDHYFQVVEAVDLKIIVSWLAHIAIMVLALWCYSKNLLLVTFGIALFYISLVPPYFALPILDVKVDYKTYLPSVGAALIVVQLVHSLSKKTGSWPVVVVSLLVCLLLGNLAIDRNRVFMTEESFWTEVIEKYPNEARPYNNRGLTFHRQRKFSEAIADFQKAIEIQPNYSLVYANIGDTYKEVGQYRKAMEYYQHYVELNPQDANGFIRVANIHAAQKRWPQSVILYEKAVEIDGMNPKALYNLALAYGQLGQYKESVLNLESLITLVPDHYKGLTSLGAIYYSLGDYGKGGELFSHALRINPTYKEAIYNLSVCKVQLRELEDASELAKMLIDLGDKRGERVLQHLQRIK